MPQRVRGHFCPSWAFYSQGTVDLGTWIFEHFTGRTAVYSLQLIRFVLGQLVLLICIAAGMTASCILLVLFGPVPVKRKVTIVPRHTPPDMFAAQPTISPQKIYATAVEPTVSVRPSSAPPALPRSRSARGTSSPQHRPSEEIQTDRVPRQRDTDSFLVDGR